MKDLIKNWKFWAIVAAVVAAIVLVVCYLTIPAFAAFVKDFLLYIVTAALGVGVGFGVGYYVAKKKDITPSR